jgi:Flp pilus assembly protein TadD
MHYRPPRYLLQRCTGVSRRVRFLCLLLLPLLAACASAPSLAPQVAALPPLQTAEGTIEVDSVAVLAPTPPLLALDPEMHAFVARYAGDAMGRRERLLALHRAISGSATLGIDYDPAAEGTATDAFHRQSANCLSYANLFVALAREAGLDARYQWVEVRPQWTRLGERIAVRLHVNAVVHMNNRDRYMVDIDPLPSRDIAGTREITDRDAQALFHSNIAMDALSREVLAEAWTHAVRALQLSPAMSHLWVNVGAVYRHAEQYRAAESAYLQALALDPHERSAMNNLMVLYDLEGNREQYAYWAERVDRYRDTNPYYHAWLGDQAGEEGDWRAALGHYLEALGLQPEDANLHFAVGLIYEQLDEPKAALRYVEQALERATLRRDLETYRLKAESLSRAELAAY